MIDEDLAVDTKNGKQTLYKVAANAVLGKGYVSAEALSEILAKQEAGKPLTAEEAKMRGLFYDELMAHATEHLLGNEAFIGKLVAKDAPLARKAFDKIVDVCKTIGGKGASKTLRTAQKLYIKAAEQSGNTRLAKYFLSHAPEIEGEESLDSVSEVRYNKKDKPSQGAISRYKSGDAYRINAVLRKNGRSAELDEFIEQMDNELENCPRFEGVTYRNISFDLEGREAFDEFFARHTEGAFVQYPAYTSSSKSADGYPIEGELLARIEIHGKNGRDITETKGLGLQDEQEVIFPRESVFFVLSVSNDGNNAIIVLEEIESDEGRVRGSDQGNYSRKQRSSDGRSGFAAVQQMQASHGAAQSEMQGIPERNSQRDFARQSGSPQAVSGGQRSEVRSERDEVSEKPKFSLKDSTTLDRDYAKAVESGDMETAQRMVDEAAKAAMPKSQIKMPDGSLRKVYHGTNSGDFTVFNPDYIGMSSGDRGFFGKGFYFAYSKGEAKYYGAKRIISAYLNITNPFDFQRELQTFNGKRAGSGRAPDAVAFLNFAEKFPEIAAKSFVSVYNGENGKDISLVEFAKAYRDVIENKRFEYQTVENEFGEKETLVLADKTVHPYDDNGVTRNYVDYGFQKRFWGDANELDVAYEYLSTVVYDYIDMYSRTRLVLDNNDEFTAKLREMGYDGAIQSADGDEAVAFLPEQIKSADPVTYDDAGNVIPLSKRFDTKKSDIRFSKKARGGVGEDLYTATDQFAQEVAAADRDLFARSLANKTADIVAGEQRSIFIFGRNLVYLFDADGYMHGKMVSVRSANEIERQNLRKRYLDETDNGGENVNRRPSFDESDRTRTGSNFSVFRNRRGTVEYDSVSYEPFKSDKSGDFGRDVSHRTYDAREVTGILRKLKQLYGIQEDGVKFSRKAPRPSGVTYEISDGQVKKLIANYTRGKTYSKKEADEAIHEILTNALYAEDERATLRGKSREEVVDMLWQGLNGVDPGKRASVALEVADYVIEHSMLERALDGNLESDADLVNLLKPYLRKLELDSLKDEIAHRYDDKVRGVLGRWGKRSGERGLPVDVVAKALAEQGFVIEEQNPADVFFAIAEAYEDATENLKTTKRLLKDAIGAEELHAIRQEIASRVLRTYDEKGSASTLTRYLDEYRKKLQKINQTWSDRFREERNRTYYGNRVLHKLRKLKDLKTGAFLNASQYKTDTFKGSIEQLSRIEHRGNLNKSSSRKILAGLAEWYQLGKGNLVITEENYDENIAVTMEILMQGEGEFSADELLTLENVLDYFTHFVQNWGKVYRDGKYVEAKPLAEMYRDGIIRNNRAKVGWLRKCFEKYYRHFGDPEALMRYMDAYDPNGFYTTMFLKLRDALTKAQLMEMEMREGLEAFYKEHKAFLSDIQEKTIGYRGQKIPVAQAMLLYMTFNREQALRGLAYSGFAYFNGKETVSVEGFAEHETDLSLDELRLRAKLEQQTIADQLSELEKKYISIAEKLFNEDCKKAKYDTDMILRGYSNAIESYYVPIRRGGVVKGVEESGSFFEELDRASNASFNKDTVKNAKNELFIEGLERVLERHVRAVSMYSNLALPINEYDVLYNLDIGGNPNKTETIGKAAVNSVFSKTARGDAKDTNGTNPDDAANEYFKKLIADIQGVSVKRDVWGRRLGKLRGSFAKFQLGANPKVWLTQLSSFLASTSILDYASVVKGLGMKNTEAEWKAKAQKRISLKARSDTQRVNEILAEFEADGGDIDLLKYGEKKRLFKKLGEQFEVFKKYENPDIKLDFIFSHGGMKESISKQRENYIRLAKLLSCFSDVVETAVGIEAHNRNKDGYKTDKTLKNVHVLLGAFVDGSEIVPVKLEVKEFFDKENTLYVAVALEGAKKDEIVKQEDVENDVAQQYSPSSHISIADLLENVKCTKFTKAFRTAESLFPI